MRLLACALLALLLLAWAQPAAAQNVRPPGNAVNIYTPENAGPQNTLGQSSQSDYWRALRQGKSGLATSGKGGGRLIRSDGEEWRFIRNEYILKYSAPVLLGVIVLLALFFIIRGKIRIKSGRSGKVIPRFSLSERVVHWFMACVFVLLGLSGLIIMLGKPLLIPLIGRDAFAIIASAAMQGHNLFGPLFALALIMLFFSFMRGNFFQLVDIKWILKGGGFFGGHVSSHRYNFGEKTWFWVAVLVGLVMSVSGFMLLFPWAIPDLFFLQAASVLHAIGAVILIAFALGHIYIGTIGMEGALEGMTRGTVDENWAREHHDLWHEVHTQHTTDDTVSAEARAARGEV